MNNNLVYFKLVTYIKREEIYQYFFEVIELEDLKSKQTIELQNQIVLKKYQKF